MLALLALSDGILLPKNRDAISAESDYTYTLWGQRVG